VDAETLIGAGERFDKMLDIPVLQAPQWRFDIHSVVVTSVYENCQSMDVNNANTGIKQTYHHHIVDIASCVGFRSGGSGVAIAAAAR
jgi:hypothetical protein